MKDRQRTIIALATTVIVLDLWQLSAPDLAERAVAFAGKEADRGSELYKKWTQALKDSGSTVLENVSYPAEPKSANQRLDLYVPKVKGNRKLPLIVWIHGGGWRGGTKEFGPFQKLVDEKQFAVASINYRLSFEDIYPAQYDDCLAALRWLTAHADQYGFDKNRIGLWGASAGGHLSALVGLRAGHTEDAKDLHVKAVCDWFGPTDLPLIIKEKQDLREQSTLEIADQFLGGLNKLDLARQASPVTYIHKGAPAFLIMHGEKDTLVPMSQSELLFNKLKSTGIPAKLDVLNDGHGGPEFDKSIGKVTAFFQSHLR